MSDLPAKKYRCKEGHEQVTENPFTAWLTEDKDSSETVPLCRECLLAHMTKLFGMTEVE